MFRQVLGMVDWRALVATTAVHGAAWTLAPMIWPGWFPQGPDGCHLCLGEQISIFTVPGTITFAIDSDAHAPDPLVKGREEGMLLDERPCGGDEGDRPPVLLAAPTLDEAIDDPDETGSSWIACVTVDPSGRVRAVRSVGGRTSARLSRAARSMRFDALPSDRLRLVRVSLRYV